jgi:hypothetical protein
MTMPDAMPQELAIILPHSLTSTPTSQPHLDASAAGPLESSRGA